MKLRKTAGASAMVEKSFSHAISVEGRVRFQPPRCPSLCALTRLGPGEARGNRSISIIKAVHP